jgi:phage baseplate assembly protein W
MADGRYINIDFPFKNSPKGFFLNLNSDSQRAIKADLMHLLLTRKGQRLYNPDFGTNLLQYIFEPNDTANLTDIKNEVTNSVKKYLPRLNIKDITVTPNEDNEYVATIRLDYTITDDAFEIADFVIINV